MKPNKNPDFRTWADTLTLMTRKEIEQALEQAFNQGYYLGVNKGWAIEQDKDWIHYEEAEGWEKVYDKIIGNKK